MCKIAICDDNYSYIQYLRNMIHEIEGDAVSIYEYETGEKLLRDMEIQHDLIILDVQLGTIDGVELAKRIRQQNKNAVLAFCSGVKQPTSESFKVTAYRYLIKQQPDEEIKGELRDILKKMHAETRQPVILVRGERGGYVVRIGDIIYISKRKHGSRVCVVEGAVDKDEDKELCVKEHLDNLYTQFEAYGFEYAHDSYIVNGSGLLRRKVI